MVNTLRPLIGIVVAVMAAGCGGSAAPPASPSPSGGGAKLAGPLTVLAAASLTEAFDDTRTALQREYAKLSITYSFAGSQQLVAQIENGAPADVIATADMPSMNKLVSAGLVQTPKVFAHNRLEIVVAPGNPKGVKGLADLARSAGAASPARPSNGSPG